MSRLSLTNLALILVMTATAACIATANATPPSDAARSRSSQEHSGSQPSPTPSSAMPDPGEVLLECNCDGSGVCPAGETPNKDISCQNAATCPGTCHFNYCKDANGRKTQNIDVSRDCVQV